MSDLISIIVPVYNAEKYLVQCIDSLINQTYINLEVLLIDDGSTDNSGNICDKFANEDGRIKVIHKENGGVSSARNTGLSLAQGEYISFIDSDDYVDKKYISAMYEKLTNTNSDITFCGYSELINDKTVAANETLPEYINVDTHDKTFVSFFCRFFSFKQYIFGSGTEFTLVYGKNSTDSTHNMLLGLWKNLGLIPMLTLLFYYVLNNRPKTEKNIVISIIAMTSIACFESFLMDSRLYLLFMLAFPGTQVKRSTETN